MLGHFLCGAGLLVILAGLILLVPAVMLAGAIVWVIGLMLILHTPKPHDR